MQICLARHFPRRGFDLHSSKGFRSVLTIFVNSAYFIEDYISEGLWALVQTISKASTRRFERSPAPIHAMSLQTAQTGLGRMKGAFALCLLRSTKAGCTALPAMVIPVSAEERASQAQKDWVPATNAQALLENDQ